MLAMHLRRIGNPVRYAMDPRVDRAVAQWLRTQLATSGIHREHAQNLHNAGDQAEPLHGLMRAMQAGDYGLLPMYHDRASESGLLHQDSVGQLRQLLAQMRNRDNRTPNDPLIQAYTEGTSGAQSANHAAGYVLQNRLPQADRLNHELLPLLARQAETGQQPWRNHLGDLLPFNEHPATSFVGRLGSLLGGAHYAVPHGQYPAPLLPEHMQVFTGAMGRRDPLVGPHVQRSAYHSMLGELPHLLNLHTATLDNHSVPGAQGTNDMVLAALQEQDRLRNYAGRGGNV